MLDQQPYLTLPALLAMISAVMHAANNILIKKGLAYSNSQTAVIFTVGMNALLLSLGALLFTPIKELWQVDVAACRC